MVDELGWDELAALLAGTLEEVWEIQDKSTTRQAELSTERIPATVSILLFFESPDCPPPDTSKTKQP